MTYWFVIKYSNTDTSGKCMGFSTIKDNAVELAKTYLRQETEKEKKESRYYIAPAIMRISINEEFKVEQFNPQIKEEK